MYVKREDPGGRLSRPRHHQVVPKPQNLLCTAVTWATQDNEPKSTHCKKRFHRYRESVKQKRAMI